MRVLINSAESRGNSSLELHSADFANLGHCADSSLALRPKFAKNHESQTENPSVVDSARYAQNLWEKSNKKSLLKFLLLFAFAKRRVPLNHINFNPSSKADSQNLAKKIARIFE